MNTSLIDNNLKNYVSTFRQNPTAFANPLTLNEIKQYGITNNEFWKKFIINMNDDDNNTNAILDDNGLYENLAKIYFIQKDNKKLYLVEKLPPITTKNIEDIKQTAEKLKQNGIEVDVNSAVLIDYKNKRYKFSKYKIVRG